LAFHNPNSRFNLDRAYSIDGKVNHARAALICCVLLRERCCAQLFVLDEEGKASVIGHVASNSVLNISSPPAACL
jgi:hypothetical protein